MNKIRDILLKLYINSLGFRFKQKEQLITVEKEVEVVVGVKVLKQLLRGQGLGFEEVEYLWQGHFGLEVLQAVVVDVVGIQVCEACYLLQSY
jgi:hypothetical protein